MAAACRRAIGWVMDYRIFRIPVLSFFFRTVRAIAIAPAKEDQQMLERAYEAIARELEAGAMVGLFPEGRLTPDGAEYEFRGGILGIPGRSPVARLPDR